MYYILEPDPEKAAHDGRCPLCGSENIGFEKDLGIYPAGGMREGKPYQQIKKSLWRCDNCLRLFASNKYITQ
jgi:hypothetical protein